MIQFFINNIELVLPEDFELSTVDENPIITKNGEFTFDIETSLLEPVNAKAFNHANRLNISSIDKDGECIMIDGGTKVVGKFIVIGNTDSNVKWQFIAGNSELNYNISQKTKIWELDFGTETIDEQSADWISFERAMDSIENPSWEKKFVCAPIKIGTKKFNDYTLSDSGFMDQFELPPSHIDSVSWTKHMPYLMHYIEKLPSLIGFELEYNILREDIRATSMYLVDNIISLKYSDYLPDWTIAEFITYVEEFFNVYFLVNKLTRKISIKKMADYIASATVVRLDNVIDSYNRDLNTDNNSKFKIGTLSYEKTSGDENFRYQKLEDSIIDACEIIEWPSIAQLKNNILSDDSNKYKIHRVVETQKDYILTPKPIANLYKEHPLVANDFLYYVNKFRDYKSANNDFELSLKIVPATFMTDSVWLIYRYSNSNENVYTNIQYPYVAEQAVEPKQNNLITAIETSQIVENSIQRRTTMEVALYSGMIELYANTPHSEIKHVKWPMPYVDDTPEFGPYLENDINELNLFRQWAIDEYKLYAKSTLRLNGDIGLISEYYTNDLLDIDYVYRFTFKPEIASSSYVYEYENQRYVVIKFDKKKSNKKTDIVGYFYRLK